jgi:hypothetical protein
MFTRLLLGISVVLGLWGGAAFGSSEAVPSLKANVGPGRTISLRQADGGEVVRLRAGRYSIVVVDQSRRDNFHLFNRAGTLDRKTGTSFVGTRRWAVTLKKGTYSYRSDANPRLTGTVKAY